MAKSAKKPAKKQSTAAMQKQDAMLDKKLGKKDKY